MSEMNGPDPALPLWTAAIGLALFLYGFGSGGSHNSDFGMELLIGLAGAALIIVGIAAQAPAAPPGI